MNHDRKTERGEPVTNALLAVSRILLGHWLYIDDKPVSSTHLVNMPLSRIVTLARCGHLYSCLSTKTGLSYSGTTDTVNETGKVNETVTVTQPGLGV